MSKNNIYLKDFQAWDPISKYIDAQVFINTINYSTKKFLYQLVKHVPFKITFIQVDDSSEFMAKFKQAYADLGIALSLFFHLNILNITAVLRDITESSKKSFIPEMIYLLIL